MAKPVRPGPVTAMAVVCFLFGGMGILGYLTCLGGLTVAVSFLSNPPPPPAGQVNPWEVFLMLDRAAPSLKYFYFGTLSASLILCIVEVIAGFGLLKMRYWGRSLAILYALLSICLIVGESAYNFTVAQPAMKQWQKDAEQWVQAQNAKAGGKAGAPPPAPGPFGGPSNPILESTGSVMGMAVGLVWPCILLFIMFMPSVRKAFAVANGHAPADEEPEDYRDRDYDDLDRPVRDPGLDPPRDRAAGDDERFRARE